ncbi:MAG: hypothetical protein WC496_10190 [Phycisphaerae bacterium]|jgi:ribosomal protein L20A (L18A)/TM2 domain-containing membrane protein YozV
MSTEIDSAKKFEDLLNIKKHNTPYFYDKLFSADGWKAKSLSKKKFKLLKKIHNQIEAMLYEDETVCFLTSGVESSFVESFFLGNLMYYINRRAFICTTQRIIIMQISSRNEPKSLRAQIEYSAIEEVRSTLAGNCKIKFKNGKTSVFSHIPKDDRKVVKGVIDFLRTSPDAVGANSAMVENLCPHCFVKVEGFPEKCQACDKNFKSPAKAIWLSFIFPGLGDFYLGQHKTIAAFEILFMLFVWISFFAPRAGEEPATLAGYIIGALIIIFTLHGFDALATRHIARKGIYPAK